MPVLGVLVVVLVVVYLVLPWIALSVAKEAKDRAAAAEKELEWMRKVVAEVELERAHKPPRPPKPDAAATPPVPSVTPRPVAPPTAEVVVPTRRVVEPAEERGSDWERKLGAQLPLWIGALALALAGVFLVRYVAHHGLLGPRARVAIAALFGWVLIGSGEWLRKGSAKIAEALVAAGVAVLFGTVWAASKLYGAEFPWLGPNLAFVMMAGVTAGAVVMSLRHGPLVALLGLLGGFGMPVLLGTGEPMPVELFGYLFLLDTGLTLVTRGRGWWWLTLATLGLSMIWAGVWLALFFDPMMAGWVGVFLLGSVGMFVMASVSEAGRRLSGAAAVVPWGAVVIGLGMVAWLTVRSGFEPTEWAFLGLLGAGCIVLGRVRERYFPMAALAGTASAAMLLAWGMQEGGGAAMRWTLIGYAVLYGGGAYAALWRSKRAARWARLSAGMGIACAVIGWWFVEELSWPRWVIAAGVAGVYAAMAAGVQWKRGRVRDAAAVMSAMVAAVTAIMGIAAVLLVDREGWGPPWITVAWAVEVLALAWMDRRLALPGGRWVLRCAAGATAVRLLANPMVLYYPIAANPVLNWLSYGYGIPAACFAAAAWRLRRAATKGDDEAGATAAGLEVTAAAMLLWMATLLIHHAFHPQRLAAWSWTFLEAGAAAIVWAGAGLGLMEAAVRERREALKTAGLIALMLGLAAAIVGAGLLRNPLWSHDAVGGWTAVNTLIIAFGIPAALAGIAAMELRRFGQADAARLAAIAAMLLGFTLVTLEVRQAFHGAYLDAGTPTNAEWYSYSAAWIVFAATLLGWGVMSGSKMLRWASLGVMLAAVGKVFLFDTRHLEDLWRVVSYLGLGVSLLLLAWVYQRFVFTHDEPDPQPECDARVGPDS